MKTEDLENNYFILSEVSIGIQCYIINDSRTLEYLHDIIIGPQLMLGALQNELKDRFKIHL